MDEKKQNKKGIKKAAQSLAAWIKAHKVIAGIIIAAMLALIVLLIFLHARSGGQKAEEGAETAVIEKRDLVQSLTLSGTVESGAAYSVSSLLTDVEVKQVNVKIGDAVSKGDVIAVLDDTELRENVDSASRSLSSAKKRNSQDISNAKRSLKNAKEDKSVQTGRTSKDASNASSQYNAAVSKLNALKSSLSSAKSELKTAERKLEQAKDAARTIDNQIAEYQKTVDDRAKEIDENEKEIESGVTRDRERALRQINDGLWTQKRNAESKIESLKNSQEVKNEAMAQADYNEASSKVSDLEEQVKDAEKNAATLKEERDKAVEADEDANRTTSRTVEDQRQALNSAYNSASENLEAPKKELRKARKDLDASIVSAEADGIVTAVNVKPGDKYKGDAIAVIQDDSSYRVSATADQYDISSLAIGQEADITITAADMTDTDGKLIYVGRTPMVSETGEVGTTGDSSSAGSGGSGANYRVEAVIQQPSERMRIGMTAKVVVIVWKKANCLAVPDEAVQTDENGNNYVVVVDDKGKERNVEVKYGMKTDYYSEIIGEDIEEGMKVLLPSYDSENDAETGETEE